MTTIKCPFCGADNNNTNIKCEICGTELISNDPDVFTVNNAFPDFDGNVTVLPSGEKFFKICVKFFLLMTLGPFLICTLAFIVVGSYELISEHNQAKNYLETEGRLVGYKDHTYNDDGDVVCTAIYEYTVRGTTYQGSPKKLSSTSSFKETVPVKYNSDNPAEYVISADWNQLLIFGIAMLLVLITIFISVKVWFGWKKRESLYESR